MKILFSKRMKELRTEKGLLQTDLAQILSTTQRRVSYLESGKIEPDLETLWKLSDYFDVSIDFLIGKKDF